MEIAIMSRNNALKNLNAPDVIDTAVISISSMDEELPQFTNKNMAILYLHFDDVDKGKPNYINETHANEIKNFVKSIRDNNYQNLVVHCGAGVSRSAGVAAALMKYLYDDDWPVFNSPKYQPNMTCYRMVLEKLMENDQ